jgi:hypothetical protein
MSLGSDMASYSKLEDEVYDLIEEMSWDQITRLFFILSEAIVDGKRAWKLSHQRRINLTNPLTTEDATFLIESAKRRENGEKV